uniref:Putative retinal tissue protein n=3 Tax=Nyssomyia neivai TaxID=330878 RepID=A0A1L8DAJ4_9DIPT
MSSDEENSVNSKEGKTDEYDDLMSMENLEGNSPELWPEKIPGVADFISSKNSRGSPTPPRGLTSEDIAAMHKLGEFTPTALAMDLKKIYDQAYQLGVQEAKEMTRGKYLNIFGHDMKPVQATPQRKSSTSSE